MFRATKTYGHELGFSCAFRQPRASSHCRFLHGYALAFTVIFEADALDQNGWVLDFGGLKDLKTYLTNNFDHRTLIAADDPHLDHFKRLYADNVIDLLVVPRVGCEGFAAQVYEFLCGWLVSRHHAPRVRLHSVEVREHGANSAICLGVA